MRFYEYLLIVWDNRIKNTTSIPYFLKIPYKIQDLEFH